MSTSGPPTAFLEAITEFESKRAAVAAFMAEKENEKVLRQYQKLAQAYNDALLTVKNQYKANHSKIGKRHGEFTIRVETHIDAEKLIKLLPNAEAAIKIRYDVDREEYKKLVSFGLIKPDVVEQVESEGKLTVLGPKEL